MCGRFSTGGLKVRVKVLVDTFDLQLVLPFEELYNVAPTLQVPVIRERDHERYLETLRWGLIPHWAKDKSIGSRMINVRLDSLAEKPVFKKPFKSQRCIILASGFYEWKREGKTKKPFYIHRADEKPITFAGLWEHWVDKATGEIIESCTIVTTEANAQLKTIHDRMPVILGYEKAKEWLDHETEDPERLKEILEHPGVVELELYPVSDFVNSVRNEGEKCIERVKGEEEFRD